MLEKERTGTNVLYRAEEKPNDQKKRSRENKEKFGTVWKGTVRKVRNLKKE
jgi:hypothetical protein